MVKGRYLLLLETVAIEAAVWNASQGKYVVKSYAEFNRGENVWFSKVGRGEFYLW